MRYSYWMRSFSLVAFLIFCSGYSFGDVIVLDDGNLVIGPNGETDVYRPKGKHTWGTPDGRTITTTTDKPIVVSSGEGTIEILTGPGNSRVDFDWPVLPPAPWGYTQLDVNVIWVDGTYSVLWDRDYLLGIIDSPGHHIWDLPKLSLDGGGTLVLKTSNGGDIVIDDVNVISVPEPSIFALPFEMFELLMQLAI